MDYCLGKLAGLQKPVKTMSRQHLADRGGRNCARFASPARGRGPAL